MKLTLLQVVQRTLSAMEADNVNSISSTYESEAIARIAEEVYYELISRADWPSLESTVALQNSNKLTEPTTLVIPENVKFIKSLWYKNKELRYLEPEAFIRFITDRTVKSDAVPMELQGSGSEFLIPSDKDPEFFTILNNKFIVCDSLILTEGSTLFGSKAVSTGVSNPVFLYEDDFVPDLEETIFPVYLSMVRRAAFLFLKREASAHDERAVISGLGRILQDKNRLFRKKSKISYGRNK